MRDDGFRSRKHFVAMLFIQLPGQDSLRGIEGGLASQAKSLHHLGVEPFHRSTLAYADEHNPDYRVVRRRTTNHLKKISSDPETGKHIVLLTNQLEWSASAIEQI